MAHQGHVIKRGAGECGRDKQEAGGDKFRRARADDAAEKARDGGTE